jgi:mono/diheme cytochrome c family protein
MIEAIYRTLNSLGYTHPLHPTLTHVVIGMVIGGFVLALVAWVFNRPGLAQSGGHCMALALIFLFPTAALGYADWQHFYGGAWLFPIKMKLVLAVVLLVLLILALGVRRGTKVVSGKTVAVYGLGLLTVVAMGYFGGELVWGKRAQVAVMAGNPVQQGAALFEQNCSACHYPDRTETKIGPGLKGILKGGRLPVSGRPATVESVRDQLITPYQTMPSFAHLSEGEVAALIAFLKTL